MVGREELLIVARLQDQTAKTLKAMNRSFIEIERGLRKVNERSARGAKQTTAQLNAASSAAKRLGGQIAATAASFIAVQRVVTGLNQALRTGVREAVAFGKSMAEVSTLVDTTTVSMEVLTAGVSALALAQGENEKIVARGLYQTISAGIQEGAESLAFLTQAQTLAVAGVSTTEQAVNLLTSAVNAFGRESLEAGRAADVLFKTVENAKTTVPLLAGSIGRVLPVAKAAGATFEEMNAALSALTLGGLSTEEAATSLRQVFVTLLSPAAEAIPIIQGIERRFGSISKDAIQRDGLITVLERIKAGVGGNVDAMGKLVPNIRALVGALALTGEQGDEFVRILDDLVNAAGAVDEAFEKQITNPAKVAEGSINAVVVGLRRAGTEIVQALGGGITTAENFEDRMNAIADAVASMRPVLVGAAASMVAFAAAAAKATQALARFVAAGTELAQDFAQVAHAVADFIPGLDELAFKLGFLDDVIDARITRVFDDLGDAAGDSAGVLAELAVKLLEVANAPVENLQGKLSEIQKLAEDAEEVDIVLEPEVSLDEARRQISAAQQKLVGETVPLSLQLDVGAGLNLFDPSAQNTGEGIKDLQFELVRLAKEWEANREAQADFVKELNRVHLGIEDTVDIFDNLGNRVQISATAFEALIDAGEELGSDLGGAREAGEALFELQGKLNLSVAEQIARVKEDTKALVANTLSKLDAEQVSAFLEGQIRATISRFEQERIAAIRNTEATRLLREEKERLAEEEERQLGLDNRFRGIQESVRDLQFDVTPVFRLDELKEASTDMERLATFADEYADAVATADLSAEIRDIRREIRELEGDDTENGQRRAQNLRNQLVVLELMVEEWEGIEDLTNQNLEAGTQIANVQEAIVAATAALGPLKGQELRIEEALLDLQVQRGELTGKQAEDLKDMLRTLERIQDQQLDRSAADGFADGLDRARDAARDIGSIFDDFAFDALIGGAQDFSRSMARVLVQGGSLGDVFVRALQRVAEGFITAQLQALIFKSISSSLGGGSFSFLGQGAGATRGVSPLSSADATTVVSSTSFNALGSMLSGSLGKPVPITFNARGNVLPPGPQLAVVNEGRQPEAVVPLRNAAGGFGIGAAVGSEEVTLPLQRLGDQTLGVKLDPEVVERLGLGGSRGSSQGGLGIDQGQALAQGLSGAPGASAQAGGAAAVRSGMGVLQEGLPGLSRPVSPEDELREAIRSLTVDRAAVASGSMVDSPGLVAVSERSREMVMPATGSGRVMGFDSSGARAEDLPLRRGRGGKLGIDLSEMRGFEMGGGLGIAPGTAEPPQLATGQPALASSGGIGEGNGNVTFVIEKIEINANDAASFNAQVARDPESIANVVFAGIRQNPQLKAAFKLAGTL